MPDSSAILGILDRARWAPSGDNTQPWRFEIVGDDHVIVHGFDTRDHVVYDLDGHASQLAIGALLETISIAATVEGLGCRIERRLDTPDTHLLIDVHLDDRPGVSPDPLAPFIEKRVVQRRAMSTRPLTVAQKEGLNASLPEGYSVVWFEGWAERFRVARLTFDNAKIRLNIPEAFQVHRAVIEWGARFSEDRIPSRAVGVDPMTERLMRSAMVSWSRIQFLNKWALGDLGPRIQLDLVPGLFCGAHIALFAPRSLRTVDDYLAAGSVMQRFWLTAASIGLFIQPEMTPVIFSRYHREQVRFTRIEAARASAGRLNARLAHLVGDNDLDRLFFMGRLGVGPAPRSRSTRRCLADLMVSAGSECR